MVQSTALQVPQLLDYCKTLDRFELAAKISPGFKLKASFIIHAVGPVWREGNHNEGGIIAQLLPRSTRILPVTPV